MRSFARIFLAFFLLVSAIAPGVSYAEPGQFVPREWQTVRVGSLGEVAFPLDNWRELAELKAWDNSPETFDLRMIHGERWITLGREEAGMLGLSPERISDLGRRFQGAPPIVFARYSPENAQLRVNVVKMERGVDGVVRVWISDFTPHHGERWRWSTRRYLTEAEEGNPDMPGRNPFRAFLAPAPGGGVQPENYSTLYCKSPGFKWNGLCTDPIFYRISWAGAQVAVGHAMRHYKAPIAFIAVPQNRFEQRVTKSGGALRKKVKYEIDGYSKPRWFVATPKELQPRGTHAQICVLPGASSCPDIRLVATSGVLVEEWKGGTMPANEDHLYHWEQTKKSWTVLAFALFTAVLTAAAWGAGLGSLFTTGWGAAAGGANISAYTAGAIAGATYAAGSIVSTGGSPTSAQDGYLGATDSGTMTPPSPGDEHSAGLAQKIQNRLIEADLGASLTGVRSLYRGACPEGYTAAQCHAAGLDPGAMPRPDGYNEHNNVLWMRENYERCQSLGYTGETLRKCAAPLPSGVFTSPGY